MELFMVRLKRHPHLYVAKTNPSYGISSDQEIKHRIAASDARWRELHENETRQKDELLLIDAHWYCKATRAKVWTSEKDLSRFTSYSAHQYSFGFPSTYPLLTLSEFEVVHIAEGKETIRPLDDFLKTKRKVQKD